MKKDTTKKRPARKTGRIVINLAAEQENLERQADMLLAYLEESDRIEMQRERCTVRPDFITDAILDAIERAGKKTGFPIPTYAPEESKETRRELLANLFSQAYRVRRPTDRERLAYAIEEILNNDLTPERLHRDVGNFYCDVSNRLNVDTAERIGEALAFGECGYGNCPGTTDGTVCPGPKSHVD